MFRIGKYIRTHRARHLFAKIVKQRFDIHVVFRNKRVQQGYRGTQLETMKSFSSSKNLLFIIMVYVSFSEPIMSVVFDGSDSKKCDVATPSLSVGGGGGGSLRLLGMCRFGRV